MVGKNGILKMIMKSVMPLINSELDRLLIDTAPFKLEVDINDKKEVVKELIHTKTGKYTFDFLTPGVYRVRLIVDTNKNRRWDWANVDKNIRAEEILHIKDKIKLKQNFELSGFDFNIEDK